MRRFALSVVALAVGLMAPTASFAGGTFTGPDYYPYVTGNDTGGIFPYAPAPEAAYEQIAHDWCARWRRLSYITSVHRTYGDYVSFVCIDKPSMIH